MLCQQSSASFPGAVPVRWRTVYSQVRALNDISHPSFLLKSCHFQGRWQDTPPRDNFTGSLCSAWGCCRATAELSLFLWYFCLLYFPSFITCISSHSHFTLLFHKLSAPFSVLQMRAQMEVTHMEVTQNLPTEKLVFATCMFVTLTVICMFWIVINAPKIAES